MVRLSNVLERNKCRLFLLALSVCCQRYLWLRQPQAEPDATARAKTTQNPAGDIVSVPFQFNFNGGGALRDGTFFNLNLQPVIPIHFSRKWTLISRTIVPRIASPDNVKKPDYSPGSVARFSIAFILPQK
jgi:hypothetical protein